MIHSCANSVHFSLALPVRLDRPAASCLPFPLYTDNLNYLDPRLYWRDKCSQCNDAYSRMVFELPSEKTGKDGGQIKPPPKSLRHPSITAGKVGTLSITTAVENLVSKWKGRKDMEHNERACVFNQEL